MKKHDNISSFEQELNKSKNTFLSFERLHMKDLLFMLYDIVAVTVAYFFALWFRFDCRFSEIPGKYLMAWLKFAPIYVVISIVVFWIFHLYQSIWKYASIAEVKRILCASGILAILHAAMITLLFCRMPVSYLYHWRCNSIYSDSFSTICVSFRIYGEKQKYQTIASRNK